MGGFSMAMLNNQMVVIWYTCWKTTGLYTCLNFLYQCDQILFTCLNCFSCGGHATILKSDASSFTEMGTRMAVAVRLALGRREDSREGAAGIATNRQWSRIKLPVLSRRRCPRSWTQSWFSWVLSRLVFCQVCINLAHAVSHKPTRHGWGAPRCSAKLRDVGGRKRLQRKRFQRLISHPPPAERRCASFSCCANIMSGSIYCNISTSPASIYIFWINILSYVRLVYAVYALLFLII